MEVDFSGHLQNELSDEEEIVSGQPMAFKVYKVLGRAICQSKCQHCGSGSSSKFYGSGNILIYYYYYYCPSSNLET